MNSHPRSRSSQLAFTLIELLVVITIIAILMGLLFPAIGVVKDQARKAEARSAVVQIATAVKQYYAEYGKYPIGKQLPGDDKDLTFGDTALGNEELFNILRNIPESGGSTNQYNPRGIVFFEGKGATGTDEPKGGYVTTAAGSVNKGAYIDPWGKPYRVIIDANYDNRVTVPHEDAAFASPNEPRTGVAVFSLGKDSVLGTKKSAGDTQGDKLYRKGSTNSDDIISWQ